VSTLVITTRAAESGGQEVLLGMKKRGFGAGRWNGFGGKVEGEETITEAAERELWEEAQIKALDLTKRGVLLFDIATLDKILEVHVFSATTIVGIPTETDEMRPQWFSAQAIPYHEMWADDYLWLPLLLEDKSFIGQFAFQDNDTMLAHRLECVGPEAVRTCPRCGLPQ